jgi:hypothetical protein
VNAQPAQLTQSDSDYLLDRARQACDRGVAWSLRDITAVRETCRKLELAHQALALLDGRKGA